MEKAARAELLERLIDRIPLHRAGEPTQWDDDELRTLFADYDALEEVSDAVALRWRNAAEQEREARRYAKKLKAKLAAESGGCSCRYGKGYPIPEVLPETECPKHAEMRTKLAAETERCVAAMQSVCPWCTEGIADSNVDRKCSSCWPREAAMREVR